MFDKIEEYIKKRKSYADTITSTKFNLDSVLTTILCTKRKFYLKGETLDEQAKFPDRIREISYEGKIKQVQTKDNVYYDLITIIDSMLPAYIAPFYHYNNYIDSFIKDFLWDDVKYSIPENEERDSNILRRLKYQIEIQAIFISIKTQLDRLILLMCYFYTGINYNTTFGRYRENKSPKGFMNLVSANKDSDDLLKFIDYNYTDWIKIAVTPRDMVIHYNDMSLMYSFDSDTMGSVPVFYNAELMKTKGSEDKPVYSFTHLELKQLVEKYKIFIEVVLEELLAKEPISYKERI